MTPVIALILGLASGLLLGGLLGWLLGVRRVVAPAVDARLEAELRQQLERHRGELAHAHAELTATRTAHAAAEAMHQAADRSLADERQAHTLQLAQLRDEHAAAGAGLRDAFKALSTDALRQTQPEFLRLANETLAKFHETAKGDLAQRHQAIAALVEPLRQQIESWQSRLQISERTQSSALGEVKRHLEGLATQSQTLARETEQLRRVLHSNPARGRWGEETLRRVIETAGLSIHCDFSEQSMAGEGKPDLLVHLPGDRVIIVDAKVPDLDFLAGIEAADPAVRAASFASHATRLRGTIKSLADRDYPRQLANALDYVVLFLPAESLFSAALEADRDLIIWAAERRILLATPASLLGLLGAVSVSWQQHAQTENARAIAEAAQEFFVRVCKFTEHFERIRSGLERANAAFNDAVGSYERMVRPGGEKLVRLGGATPGKELAGVPLLEQNLRTVSAPAPVPAEPPKEP